MAKEPSISLVAAILIVAYVVIADLIGVFLVFFGLDDFMLLDILVMPVTQFYFRLKGVKANYDLVTQAAEFAPYVGALPLKTVGVLVVIWLDWRQG